MTRTGTQFDETSDLSENNYTIEIWEQLDTNFNGNAPVSYKNICFHAQSVALEWAATASSAMAASSGCTRNAVGSSA